MHMFRSIPAVDCRALAPLLLAVAVSHACAADVTVIGQPGAPAVFSLVSTEASNTLNLTGGRGQNAVGIVESVSGAPIVSAYANVRGGAGYDSAPGAARPLGGGDASSTVAAYGAGAASVVARAEAVAGWGGPNWSSGGMLDGGVATAQAYGQSDTGNVAVSASATGGNATSVSLDNAVSGKTRGQLALSQHARGATETRDPQLGYPPEGHARSILDLTDSNASALSANISATGGGSEGMTAAGYGESRLTLTSTRAGANVSGVVMATGGGIGTLRGGGHAIASGVLAGTADVSGNVAATGGNSYPGGWWSAFDPGTALASLSVNAGGLATGTVTAQAGQMSYTGTYYYNDGAATLTLVGAGARGSALAVGGNATSDVGVRTTGVQAVDVTSSAQLGIAGRYSGGTATANTDVSTAAGNGSAAVRAAAYADGGSTTGTAIANVRVASAGDIVAIARAKGGYPSMCCYDLSGDAITSVIAATSGKHDVNATATSVASIGSANGTPSFSGNGTATAYGRSGSGVVNVVADARGGEVYGVTVAFAHAVTTDSGGVSRASAVATGVDVTAQAEAGAIGRHGYATGFGSTASGAVSRHATAIGSSQFAQSAWALPAAGGDYVTAAAMAAPDVAGGAATGELVGAGMHAVSNTYTTGADPWELPLVPMPVTSTSFQFATGAEQHVQIAFSSSAGTGFDLLEFTILNHGQELFSRSFLGSAEADLFFNGTLLDLGWFGAGMQDLVIRSAFTFTTPGSYGFNYLVGTSVSAVPEPSTWLAMLLGLGTLVMVARRRKG